MVFGYYDCHLLEELLYLSLQCAYLRMRLTEAAAAGASWAVLDLAGLPVDDSDDAMEDCRQK